jgi:hypothetical protein
VWSQKERAKPDTGINSLPLLAAQSLVTSSIENIQPLLEAL